jgi:hypothetical protein
MQFSRINLTLGIVLLLGLIAIANSYSIAAKNPRYIAALNRAKGAVIAFGFEESYLYTVEIDSEGKITAYNPKCQNSISPFPSTIP